MSLGLQGFGLGCRVYGFGQLEGPGLELGFGV